MENKFYTYIQSMIHNLIIEKEDEGICDYNMNLFYCLRKQLEDLLESDCTHGEYIISMSGEELWDGILHMDNTSRKELGIEDPVVITKNFLSVLMSNEIERYDFAEEFLEDMAEYMAYFPDPTVWLNDLISCGCVTGMVSKLIYNSDCKELYVKYIDSMEELKSDLEDEIGEVIKSTNNLPHYTFLCWLCYEELGRMVYDKIEEED